MCDRCDELNRQIVRYRELARFAADIKTRKAIESLIATCKVEKRTLHPSPNK
jgi:hypothetical protein